MLDSTKRFLKKIIKVGECTVTMKDQYQTTRTYKRITNAQITNAWLLLITDERIPHYEPIFIENIAALTIPHDKETKEELWKAEREKEYGKEDVPWEDNDSRKSTKTLKEVS